MQKIVPHLWFDKEAGAAAVFYTSIFSSSFIKNRTTIHDTPSGSVEILTVELAGHEFVLMSAGPFFKFTPAVSFLVACDTKEEVDRLWKGLREGGKDLMPLDAYPFSEKYGWLEDKYGLSWQLMYMGARKYSKKITPTLMFSEDQCGKTEEALRFYASVFRNAKVGEILRYGSNEEPDKPGTIRHAAFSLEGQDFAAMDSARAHGFGFNEAISLIVYCDGQAELDHFWGALSAHPQAEQCGWLKDKYGVSWQIIPVGMDELMQQKDPVKSAKVTAAMLKMKKLDISELKKAAE
jgi:predicted 3-demethylubiquinone-9 3-methyltransferase (glyoxalase superfamily)